MKIFPNPAREKIQVQVSASLIGKRITIYSSEGRLMLDSTIDSVNTTVPLSGFSEGMYFLHIGSRETSSHSEKFFILKE